MSNSMVQNVNHNYATDYSKDVHNCQHHSCQSYEKVHLGRVEILFKNSANVSINRTFDNFCTKGNEPLSLTNREEYRS